MPGFLIRMFVSAAGLALAGFLVPGIKLEGTGTLLAAALLLGIVNAVLRPLVIFFTIPLTLATLGLFLLVINAGMFAFVAWLLSGFSVSGFLSALAGSLIVSFTSWLASWYIGPNGRVQVLIVRQE